MRIAGFLLLVLSSYLWASPPFETSPLPEITDHHIELGCRSRFQLSGVSDLPPTLTHLMKRVEDRVTTVRWFSAYSDAGILQTISWLHQLSGLKEDPSLTTLGKAFRDRIAHSVQWLEVPEQFSSANASEFEIAVADAGRDLKFRPWGAAASYDVVYQRPFRMEAAVDVFLGAQRWGGNFRTPSSTEVSRTPDRLHVFFLNLSRGHYMLLLAFERDPSSLN